MKVILNLRDLAMETESSPQRRKTKGSVALKLKGEVILIQARRYDELLLKAT